MDTFNTPMLGALGYVDEENIRIYRVNDRVLHGGTPEWATPFDLGKISKGQIPEVEIAYVSQDAGGGAIDQFVKDGVKGIVTAGTGAGGLSAKMRDARTKAIEQGVVFVTTTRTGSGTMYGGSEGVIAGDSLNAQHARILLAVSLAFSQDFQTVKGWFETVGNQDMENRPSDEKGTAADDLVGHWAETAMRKAASLGFIAPAASGSFLPDEALTRAEFVSQIIGAMKPEGPAATGTPFSDQALIDAKAAPAVARAVQMGLISGYEDGSFRPGQGVSRAEMAVVLAKALNIELTDGVAAGFTDSAVIPGWAAGAIEALRAKGLVEGHQNGEYAPLVPATRGEAVTILLKLLEAKGP
ncbi:Endo-1,4-beta-xylanase A precursor [compost metagenome]